MSTPRIVSLAAAAAIFAAAAASRAQTPPPSSPQVLDVPYIAQSEALCGGAAAAMVMRYWGAIGVYAESFAELVDREAGGIRASALVESLRLKAWDAHAFSGTADTVAAHLAQGRPVVALIEDRPGRHHYVVLVAWWSGRVLLHDPARAPFRVLSATEFTRAWTAAGSWALLLLPGAEPIERGLDPLLQRRQPPPTPAPCSDIIQEGIRLGTDGDPDGARRLFQLAAEACPGNSTARREMAGLHALRREWPEAAVEARRATAMNPADDHAWRILATASYLTGDEGAALDAWNHVGEPVVDLVDVKGLERTRYMTIASAVAIEPRSILTSGALARARRRVGELPSVQAVRIAYRPAGPGLAEVDVAVFERPMLPTTPASLAAAGVHLLSDREAAVVVASPAGAAETWNFSWRWWEQRPRVALGLAVPIPPGVIRIVTFDERETYGSGDVERRRGATIALADWLGADTRWDVSLGADRWHDRAPSPSIGAGVDRHVGQLVVLSARATAWPALARTWAATTRLEWRSRSDHEGHVWTARAGLDAAGSQSPLALWSAAGSGARAAAPLRAHPVLDDGRIEHAAFGRRLVHAGVEWRRWFSAGNELVRVGPAAFVDVARASRGASFSDTRAHADVGAGLRFVLPGYGVVGLDLARGLRDGRMAVSIGWRR